MKKSILMLSMMLLFFSASVYASPGLTLHSTTRYESHSMASGDNSGQEILSLTMPLGSKSSVVGTAGLVYDFQDSESSNTIVGLAYVYSYNKKSYFISSYSNFRLHGSAEDLVSSDTLDSLYFMHSYGFIKRSAVNAYVRTALTTDTAFDTNRVWSEQLYMTFPYKRKITASLGLQYNYSLEQDKHSHNVYDFGISTPIARNGKLSLTYRRADYKLTGIEDNIWLFTYSHRLM